MSAPAFWRTRSPRERAVIGWGAGTLAAIALFVLVWLPLERARARIDAQLPQLRASVEEMRVQAAEVKALRALPAPAVTPLATLVASGTLAQGLPGARLTALDARRVKVGLDDASWTRLVEWLAATGAAHGLAVEEAKVEALPASGRVRAEVVLTAP